MERQRYSIPFPDGWTPRILENLDLPSHKDIVLSQEEQAALINRDLIMGFRFLKRDKCAPASDSILVARERSKPVKIVKTGDEIAVPSPEYRGQFGVLLLGIYGRKRFYVGEDYRVDVNERTESDRANRILRLEIHAVIEPMIQFIPGNLDFSEVLTALNRR